MKKTEIRVDCVHLSAAWLLTASHNPSQIKNEISLLRIANFQLSTPPPPPNTSIK
jgi:hypothetical protein